MTEEERIELLKRDFIKVGLVMRPDSKLCSKFIENGFLTAYNSTFKIATRMAEMHFLYNYTQYPMILEEKTKIYEFRLSNNEVPYIKPQVESEYIALRGGNYPSTWPWVQEVQENLKMN
jgi:hypothetical protein